MAQPFKHPTSGMYYLRRRVPDELHPVLGKEYKRSLKTRDAAEAKARFAAAWVQCEEAFSLARAQSAGSVALEPFFVSHFYSNQLHFHFMGGRANPKSFERGVLPATRRRLNCFALTRVDEQCCTCSERGAPFIHAKSRRYFAGENCRAADQSTVEYANWRISYRDKWLEKV